MVGFGRNWEWIWANVWTQLGVGYSYVLIKIMYAKVTRIQFILNGWGVDFSAGVVDFRGGFGRKRGQFWEPFNNEKSELEEEINQQGINDLKILTIYSRMRKLIYPCFLTCLS